MQYRDGHISTCLIKTLGIYLYCAYMLVPVIHSLSLFVIYSFVLVYSLLSFIYFVHCSTIYSFVVFIPYQFFVCCSREKITILILNCVQIFFFFFFLYIFWVFVYIVYLCRPSEASTWYCVIPGGYPPQD